MTDTCPHDRLFHPMSYTCINEYLNDNTGVGY